MANLRLRTVGINLGSGKLKLRLECAPFMSFRADLGLFDSIPSLYGPKVLSAKELSYGFMTADFETDTDVIMSLVNTTL